MKSTLALWIALGAAGLAAPATALATSLIFLSDVEQALDSTAVVVATATRQRVDQHPTWGRPITLTAIEVQEVLYGAAPDTLEVEQFGGELEGVMTYVPGDAHLEVGERAVLFLRHAEGSWHFTAMEQSAYEIVPSVAGDALNRDLSASYFRRDDAGQLVPVEDVGGPLPTVYDLRVLLSDLSTEADR